MTEVEEFGEYLGSVAPSPVPPTNYALGKSATQSRTAYGGVASRATDGNTDGRWNSNSVTHTPSMFNPSWSVELEALIEITSINVYNRVDCCSGRLSGFKVIIWKGDDEVFTFTQSRGVPAHLTTVPVSNVAGDKVEIMLPGNGRILSLAEVEVLSP